MDAKTYIRGSGTADTLICWLSEALCKGDELVTCSLQFTDGIWYYLVTRKRRVRSRLLNKTEFAILIYLRSSF